jgi:predicted Zn-dependent peptidase
VFAGGAAKEQRRLEQAHLVLLAPAFSRHDPEFFALSLFTEILGGGMSSRLFQEARERRGLAYAIDAYPDSYEDVGVLGVYAGTAAENARPTAQLVAGEILKLAEDVCDAELSRAKAQMKGGLFMRREAPLARAEAHANNLHSFGRIFEVAELAQQIDAVDVEGVQGVARTIAGRGRAASAVLGPKAALAAGAAFAEALAAG